MENGTFVHRESQAYRRKVLANEWLRRREHEMDQEHAFGQAPGRAQENFSGELLRDYVSAVKNVTEWGRCKKAGIARLQASGRADLQAAKLTVQDLMGHTKQRRTEDDASPPPCSMTWCGCARSSCMLRPRAALMRRCRCWTAPGLLLRTRVPAYAAGLQAWPTRLP